MLDSITTRDEKMKCPICENYFDRDHTKFQRFWHAGKDVIRICPECFERETKAYEQKQQARMRL
jgi:hypothetical protein